MIYHVSNMSSRIFPFQMYEQCRRLIPNNYFPSLLWNGEYNIQKALGDKYNAILKIANNAEKELGITASAKAGVASLNKILADKGGVVNTLANLASAKMPLTNKLVEGLQGSVSKNAMNVLQNAVMSGKNMNQLLNTAPYSVKAELARAIQGNPLLGGITTATLNQGQQ